MDEKTLLKTKKMKKTSKKIYYLRGTNNTIFKNFIIENLLI